MNVNWLLGSAHSRLESLSAEVVRNEIGLAADKAQLSARVQEKLVSPLGLVGCFGAGCAAEYLVASGKVPAMRLSALGTTAYTMAHKFAGI